MPPAIRISDALNGQAALNGNGATTIPASYPTLQVSGTPTSFAPLPTTRTLQLFDPARKAKSPIATLTYYLTPAPWAMMQLLHIEVAESHRRQGHGTRLYEQALTDARTLLGTEKLRRIYCTVPHKSHLNFRALLTRLGFHHTATTTGLLKGEDLLTYIKSYT